MVKTNWDKVSLQIPAHQITKKQTAQNTAAFNTRHGVLAQPVADPRPRLRKLPVAHNVQRMHFFTMGDAARWLRSAE